MRRGGSIGAGRLGGAPAWFAAFTLLSLVLLLVATSEPVRTAQRLAGAALEPARGAVAIGAETVRDAIRAIGEIGSLRAENDALRLELAAAASVSSASRCSAAENAELRGLLDLTRALDMELLPVRISGREPSSSLAECVVDAGSDAGIAVGMPVLADAGGAGALIGTVVEVTDHTARVRFVVDARSVVIARDQQSRALGEVRGQSGDQLVLVNVPVTERLEIDDTVVTAGISVGGEASRYPPGLLIGRIQAVEPDENALTQTAYLVPALDPAELERLLVVLDSGGG